MTLLNFRNSYTLLNFRKYNQDNNFFDFAGTAIACIVRVSKKTSNQLHQVNEENKLQPRAKETDYCCGGNTCV